MFFSYDFVGSNSWNGYERNCLFANDGGTGQFIDIARASGGDEIKDSRGVAIADFNGDGRLDIAINNNNNVPALYWNRLTGGRSLSLDLVGGQSNSDAVGARARVTLAGGNQGAGGKTLTRWVEAGAGYASQGAHTLHFGLGPDATPVAVEVHWPSGHVDRFEGADLPAMTDRTHGRLRLREGGELVAAHGPVDTDGDAGSGLHSIAQNTTSLNNNDGATDASSRRSRES